MIIIKGKYPKKYKNLIGYPYRLIARVAPRIITMKFEKVGEAPAYFHSNTDDFSA